MSKATDSTDESAESFQPVSLDERLRAGDAPKFVYRGHTISINEVHALTYGLVGLPIGALLHNSFDTALWLAVIVMFVAFGLLRVGRDRERYLDHCHTHASSHQQPDASRVEQTERSALAIATVRHEPHYFLASFVGWLVGGYLLPVIVGLV